MIRDWINSRFGEWVFGLYLFIDEKGKVEETASALRFTAALGVLIGLVAAAGATMFLAGFALIGVSFIMLWTAGVLDAFDLLDAHTHFAAPE